MSRSFIFLADGFEEIEALTVVDVMRRAGMDLKTISISESLTVAGTHGVSVVADALFEETDFIGAEWLIIPGGMPGTSNLAEYEPLNELLIKHSKEGKIAAICAAPALVLAPLGLLDGREATCYSGMESLCRKAVMKGVPVVAHDDLITANGPASALMFSLAIVANSLGEDAAHQIGSAMLFYPKAMNLYL